MKDIIFTDKEHYLTFRKTWAENANKSIAHDDDAMEFLPEHFFIYALLRGKDPRKCFDPKSEAFVICSANIGNALKFDQEWSIKRYLTPFGDTLTKVDLQLAWDHYWGKVAA